MGQLLAITRAVSPAIARCELTHLSRVPIDPDKAAAQHADYERALERMGCAVRRIAAGQDLPDSVFIEDAAVVLDEVAIVTRPGAESRRAEAPGVAEALEPYRPLLVLEPPGTLDGGDVLVVGRSMFIGTSRRTNLAGIEQMRHIAAPLGYAVRPVSVRGCLHLKSAVTSIDDQTLLVNRAWAPLEELRGFKFLDVDPGEPSAANIVRVGTRLLYSASFPRTRARIERRGFDVTAVDVSELAKAEGAVTCCSLIFEESDCLSAA
ncbi:MAG: dimethylargininase [Acidobacteria bacterium RIFCSPLOWO2_02_FULL_65_29]|nr:MAG: dimethylargininase [Acidobacteria bacterium RIFCSPLOWO2_02_FULL_65_29]